MARIERRAYASTAAACNARRTVQCGDGSLVYTTRRPRAPSYVRYLLDVFCIRRRKINMTFSYDVARKYPPRVLNLRVFNGEGGGGGWNTKIYIGRRRNYYCTGYGN